MWLYRAMPTGIPFDDDNAQEMHVVELEEGDVRGQPPGLIGIKLRSRQSSVAGKLSPSQADSDASSRIEERPVHFEHATTIDGTYWADQPSWRWKTYVEDLRVTSLSSFFAFAAALFKWCTADVHLILQYLVWRPSINFMPVTPDGPVREQAWEARSVWRMFKEDPLQPVRSYCHQFAMTGVGLFLEGYVIFSISNNSTLFKQAYKRCWSTFQDCNQTWTQATTYLQLVGILIGQLFFGFMGDAVGRRTTMLVDMGVILAGVILLTAAGGTTPNSWVICFAMAQLIFGIGIGGEYPMTSTRATEESEEDRQYSQRHRGRKVMLSYTMQGWGQFVNLGVLILLLLIFNSSGNPPYSHAAAGATWRTSFGLLIPLVLYVIYYRVWRLKELTLLKQAKKRDGVTGYDWQGLRLMLRHFWHRLIGSAGIWFCNDWYFYGNGVFRSTFVGILVGPKAGVLTNWLYSWINSGVQLVGYYAAALSVDYRWLGRKKLTCFSFLWVAGIFAAVAGAYPQLILKKNIHIFQFLYYMSSFWALYGSHTTSFLLSAEMYPAQVRGTAHGISAATGKVGSICVVVLLNYIDNRLKFWVTWPVALAGSVICWFFIADTAGLDLNEQERRWEYIRNGREQDYHGPAVHPQHLSWWERNVLKLHRNYDPVADSKQQQQRISRRWSVKQEARQATDGLLVSDSKDAAAAKGKPSQDQLPDSKAQDPGPESSSGSDAQQQPPAVSHAAV